MCASWSTTRRSSAGRIKMAKDSEDQVQSRRFIETARALDCDEDECAFKAKLAVIVRQNPKDKPKLIAHKKP